MKYIDAERLRVEIERRRKICADIAANKRNEEVAEYYRGKEVAYDETSSLITSLLQEQPKSGSSEKPNNLLSEKLKQREGIEGIVHHALGAHYIITNQEQLNARLKQFSNDAKVEIFVNARKED